MINQFLLAKLQKYHRIRDTDYGRYLKMSVTAHPLLQYPIITSM